MIKPNKVTILNIDKRNEFIDDYCEWSDSLDYILLLMKVGRMDLAVEQMEIIVSNMERTSKRLRSERKWAR